MSLRPCPWCAPSPRGRGCTSANGCVVALSAMRRLAALVVFLLTLLAAWVGSSGRVQGPWTAPGGPEKGTSLGSVSFFDVPTVSPPGQFVPPSHGSGIYGVTELDDQCANQGGCDPASEPLQWVSLTVRSGERVVKQVHSRAWGRFVISLPPSGSLEVSPMCCVLPVSSALVTWVGASAFSC